VLVHLCRVSFNPDACLERAVDGFHRRMAATILFAKFLRREHDHAAAGGGLRGAGIRFPAAGPGRSSLWAGAAVALDSLSGAVAETARGVQG